VIPIQTFEAKVMGSGDDIDWEAIEIQLLPDERKLLLKYGYPFENEEKQLKAMVKSKEIIETLVISRSYLSTMIGDLSHSINKKTTRRIQGELLELCQRLEHAEAWGDGELDIMW
jgi:hypothetical protein